MQGFDSEGVIVYEEDITEQTEFCTECCSDVKLDDFGMPACKQCNPQYDEELSDEDGNIKELNFRDIT